MNKGLTTSKLILYLVMLTYFYGLILGTYLVVIIVNAYPEWAIQAYLGMLTYIGAPVAVTISFYSWKAKHENCLKIVGTTEVEDEHSDIAVDAVGVESVG